MSIPQAKHEMRIGVLNEVLKIGVLGMRSGIETSVCRGKKAFESFHCISIKGDTP
jgi:hypothetical protein